MHIVLHFHLQDSLKNVREMSEKSEYFTLFFRSFNYRNKVIIEGVSNFIEIDYGLTVI